MKNDYDIALIYREMELHLISSMQRNLGRHLKDEIAEGKEWKMWQAEKLKELKRYQRQNKDIVDFYTSGLSKEVADILKEEFKQGHKSEINKYNKLFDKKISDSFFKLDDRKANVLINVVNNDLNEANKAVLRMMNDTYRQTIHKAATFANTGVMTQKQAVDMATKDFLSRGLAVIEYKDGKRVNIASYAQMAVRTASQRAMLMGEGEFRKSIGETQVIISKHGTACRLCQPHESKVYIDNVYSGGKPDGKHKLLSDAMKEGLFHPNCRHGISTYYGLDDEDEQETTVNVPEENNNEDAARLDREIQKADRKIAGSQDKDNILNAKLDKSKWVSRRDKLRAAPKTLSNEELNKSFKTKLMEVYERNRIELGLNMTPLEEIKDNSFSPFKVDFGNVDNKIANSWVNQFEKLSDEYYTTLTSVTQTKIYDGPLYNPKVINRTEYYFNVSNSNILINNNLTDYDKFMKRMDDMVVSNHSVKISKENYDKYVATHEFAHTLSLVQQESYKTFVGADIKKMKEFNNSVKDLFEEYKNELKTLNEQARNLDVKFVMDTENYTNADHKLRHEIKEKIDKTFISRYSNENADEFMAEAFTDYKLGENPSNYSIKVGELIDKYFKRGVKK